MECPEHFGLPGDSVHYEENEQFKLIKYKILS